MIAELAGRVLAGLERRLAALPLRQWSGVDATFIVSTGRTGTLRLAQVLEAVTDGTHVVHEPPPDLFDLGEATARGTLSPAEAAPGLRRARQPARNRLWRSGTNVYVESNNNVAYLPAVIREVFDAPRFVHVVRDGPATVRSLYSNTTWSRRSPRHRALFMDHDDHRCRLAAVDFPDDPWFDEWPDLTRFERVCWYWAKKNSLIREGLEDRPDSLVVRFEDIFDRDSGHRGFHDIVDFTGLSGLVTRSEPEIHELLSKRSNRAASYRLPPPSEWPAELVASFERIAGAEHRRYYP